MVQEMMIESNAVIGDLEMDNMQLRDEMEEMKRRYEEEQKWARTLWNIIQRDKVTPTRKQNEVESLVREMLDEAIYEEDSDRMKQLRKILWTDDDTEKQIEAEGYMPF